MIQIMQILKKEQNLSVESVMVMEISKMEHIVAHNVNMTYTKNVLMFYFNKTKILNINNHNNLVFYLPYKKRMKNLKKKRELLTKMKIKSYNK